MPRLTAALLSFPGLLAAGVQDDGTLYFDGRRPPNVAFEGTAWKLVNGMLEGSGAPNALASPDALGDGDFTVRLRLSLAEVKGTGAEVRVGENHFVLDAPGQALVFSGPWFDPGPVRAGDAAAVLPGRRPFELEIRRSGATLSVSVERQVLYTGACGTGSAGRVSIHPERGTVRLQGFFVSGTLVSPARASDADRARLQPRIDRAVDRGVAYLLSTQLRDGSWGYHAPMFGGGQTALSLYTLVKAGLPANHPAIQRGIAYLGTVEPDTTYSIACFLLAYGAIDARAHRARIHELAGRLAGYGVKGKWSYPHEHRGDGFGPSPGIADLSNTQFAALGLWEAVKSGFAVPAARWQELVEATLAYQEKPVEATVPLETGATSTGRTRVAGFGYRLREGPTGSMTCAGIGVLRIAKLCAGGSLPRPLTVRLDESVEAAANWLRANYSVRENPRKSDWIEYYLYGLERACSLLKVETLAGHDWYHEGATFLVESQGSRGSWGAVHTEPDTCFAILFLRRATGGVSTGAAGRQPADVHASDDPFEAVSLRGTGTTHLTVWVSGFGEAARNAAREAPRVVRVEYLVNGTVAAVVEGNPAKPWTGERYAATCTLTSKGEHRVGARVTIAGPAPGPGADASTRVVSSKGFVVKIDAILEPWMLDWARRARANLLAGQDLTITASSRLTAGEGGEKAADGFEGTRWLCAKDDPVPSITVELASAVRADTVTLGPCCTKDESRGIFDRIREAEVRVNKERVPVVVTFATDEMAPAIAALPKPVLVKSIEVRVTRRDRGGGVPGSTGFGEIGLELRSR